MQKHKISFSKTGLIQIPAVETQAAQKIFVSAEIQGGWLSVEQRRHISLTYKSEPRAAMHWPDTRFAPFSAGSAHGRCDREILTIPGFFKLWFWFSAKILNPLSILTQRRIIDSRNPSRRTLNRRCTEKAGTNLHSERHVTLVILFAQMHRRVNRGSGRVPSLDLSRFGQRKRPLSNFLELNCC